MADVSIIEAISLITKVSADNSKILKSLTSSSGSKVKGGKEELVKKADPVIVTDFGKAAEKDLAKLGGDAEKERQKTETEKNKNNNLLKLLGLAGAAKQLFKEGGPLKPIPEENKGLKALAKELNVPIIALSQLSRQVEQREDKRPQLSDLRESGTIEQDSDVVMFIYRESYYLERL